MQHQAMVLVLSGLLLNGGFTFAAQAQTSDPAAPFPPPRTDASIVNHTEEIVLTLQAVSYPSYSALMEQARQSATDLIERAFHDNPDWDDVSVHILGSRGENILPLLITQVSRSDWQSRPDIDYWGQSTGLSARLLLGLDSSSGQSVSSGVALVSVPTRSELPTPRGRSSRMRRILSGQ
jgi:hypothetical protein